MKSTMKGQNHPYIPRVVIVNQEKEMEDNMTFAKQGDTVKVHYTGKLVNGAVFGSSLNREPLQFQIGTGKFIPGFEKAVIGMKPGDTKTTEVPPEEGYGPRLENRIHAVRRDLLPENFQPEVGQQLEMLVDDGKTQVVTVAHVTEDQVIVDANHPLAGQELAFDIQLLEIV